MVIGVFLSIVVNNLEDVVSATIRCCLKLLMQASKLIGSLQRSENGRRHDRLRVPSSQSTHDRSCLFIRIHRSGIGFVVVLEGRIGIKCSLCRVVSYHN